MRFLPVLLALAASLGACSNFTDTTEISQLQANSRPVDFSRELVITDTKIVRESKPAQSGAWTFNNVMKELSGKTSSSEVDHFFEQWAQQWDKPHAFNNDEAEIRPLVKELLVDAWQHNRIDLIAIVNRIDLTRFEDNKINNDIIKLGEGRLVFEVVNQANFISNFTIILEYQLPTLDNGTDLRKSLVGWAKKWRELGSSDLTLEQRISKLEKIIALFATRENLKQIRTNELAAEYATKWEMREYILKKDALVLHTVAQTPRDDARTEQSSIMELEEYISANTREILVGTYDLSESPEGRALLGIKAQFDAAFPDPWKIKTVDQQALNTLSFNTCNGCHKITPGLNTENQHIFRDRNGDREDEALLSPFLRVASNVKYPLPGCSISINSVSKPWCDDKQWNEREMRESLLLEFANETKNDIKEGSMNLTNTLIEVLGTRVH